MLIERILPRGVRAAEAFGDAVCAPLTAEEESLVANAVDSRRREFATARACARRALRTIGVPPVSIGSGRHGDPLWPDWVVGSITHCNGYRAAAVARSNSIPSIGIDAEPAEALPRGLISSIVDPSELRQLAALACKDPTVPWDRLAFSIKESTYKAWFVLGRQALSPKRIQVTIDPDENSFLASVHPQGADLSGLQEGPESPFHGRWTIAAGLVITAASPLPAPAPRRPAGLREG